METNFRISERTNKLLNIMADFEKLHERVFLWAEEEWGEDSIAFQELYEELYEAHNTYLDFLQKQLASIIQEKMQNKGNTEI